MWVLNWCLACNLSSFSHTPRRSKLVIKYTDGTAQRIEIMAYSEVERLVSYVVVESQPALPVKRMQHTIQLQPQGNDTFLEFHTDFSEDIALPYFVQSKYTKRSFFAALRRETTGRAAMLNEPRGAEPGPMDFGERLPTTTPAAAAQWDCGRCTFTNSESNSHCEMCNTARQIVYRYSDYHKILVKIPYSQNDAYTKFTTESFTLCGHKW